MFVTLFQACQLIDNQLATCAVKANYHNMTQSPRVLRVQLDNLNVLCLKFQKIENINSLKICSSKICTCTKTMML